MTVPALALAQNTGTLPPVQNSGTPPPVQNAGCPSGAFCLSNPTSSFGTFCSLLKAIFNDLLILGIPVATLFIVYAGFMLVTARGNREKLNDAKRNLFYIVIGVALFLGAWALSQIIAATLAQLGGGGGLC